MDFKGIFITFEGIEGSGKTTQIRQLENYLASKGYPTLLTKEPGGTLIGTKIREILLSTKHQSMAPLTELYLYCADRHQHLQEIILPALKEGKIILCDRYSDATMAYQGAGRQIDLQLLKTINAQVTEGLIPHLTFLFDLSVEIGMSRIQKRELDRFEQEKKEFHEKVRREYLKIAKAEPKRIKVLDATQAAEILHQQIVQEVEKQCGPKR